MSNGFIYVVDAHFIDKIEEEENILDPSACGHKQNSVCVDKNKKLTDIFLKKTTTLDENVRKAEVLFTCI